MQPDAMDGMTMEMEQLAACWYCGVLTKTAVALHMGAGQYDVRPVCYEHLASEIAGQGQEGQA